MNWKKHILGTESFTLIFFQFWCSQYKIVHLIRAVHQYPVPAPYRIPLRKIPGNTRFCKTTQPKQALSLVLDIHR